MDRTIIEAEIEQALGRSGWTHKIHEKQAEIYHSRRVWAERIRIVISALSTSGIFAILLNDQSYCFKLLTAIISLISTGLNLYLQKFDFHSLEKAHKESAVRWLELREDYVSLISEFRSNVLSDDEIIKKKRELSKQYKKACQCSPITTDGAYKKAKKALQINLDNIISEDEIDIFLPKEIRKEKD